MAFLHLPAEPVELDQQSQVLVAVLAISGSTISTSGANSSQAASRAFGVGSISTRRRSAGIGYPLRVAGALEPVDHGGDRARRQPAGPGELAGAHLAAVLEQVEAAPIGAVDAHQLDRDLVDDRGGALVGADLVAELLQQGSPFGRSLDI